MDGLQWKTLLNWMIWAYPYFWKHPYIHLFIAGESLKFFVPRVAGIADSGENGHCHTLVQGEGKGQKHNHSPGDVKRKNEHDCKINIRQLRIPKRSQKIFWYNTYVLDQSTFSLVFKQKSLCFACSMRNGSYTPLAQGYSSPSRPLPLNIIQLANATNRNPTFLGIQEFQRSQKKVAC